MSPMLDLNKLEKVRERGGKTIARCPACAETGNDKKGEHLFIAADGKFGCVQFPGTDGEQHRTRIFALAGIRAEKPVRRFAVTFAARIRRATSTRWSWA